MLAEIFMLRSETAIRQNLAARSSADGRFVPVKLPIVNQQPSPTKKAA